MTDESLIMSSIEHGETYSTRDLGSLLGRPAGSVVALLRSMEKRGLIKKVPTFYSAAGWMRAA